MLFAGKNTVLYSVQYGVDVEILYVGTLRKGMALQKYGSTFMLVCLITVKLGDFVLKVTYLPYLKTHFKVVHICSMSSYQYFFGPISTTFGQKHF